MTHSTLNHVAAHCTKADRQKKICCPIGNQRMPHAVTRAVGFAFVTLLIFSAQAIAQDRSSDWSGSIGAGVFYGPEFLGSTEDETGVLPMFELTYRDRYFIGTQGIGANIIENERFRFSSSLGYETGREEKDSVLLAGLGNIDGGATLDFGFEYDLGPVTSYLQVSKHFKGSEGISGAFGVGAGIPMGVLTGRTNFSDLESTTDPSQLGPILTAGLSADFGDGDYNQAYFGVTGAQSASSGLGAFKAGSGINSVDLSVGVTYPINERWGIGGNITYSRLVGDANNSPITREKDGVGVGLFAVYNF